MPKILINEKDYTSPGGVGRYANHAILIAGLEAKSVRIAEDVNIDDYTEDPTSGRVPMYKKEPKLDPETYELIPGDYEIVYNRPVTPDENGAYEFNSAEDFRKTIGLVSPKFETKISEDSDEIATSYHYGNQMAFELLKIGYPIIYISVNPATFEKPIVEFRNGNATISAKKDTDTQIDAGAGIKRMLNESFWLPFRDKASYDFRFITHGLLESSPSANDIEDSVAYTEAKDAVEAQRVAVNEKETELKDTEAALEKILGELTNIIANNSIKKTWDSAYYDKGKVEVDKSIEDPTKDSNAINYMVELDKGLKALLYKYGYPIDIDTAYKDLMKDYITDLVEGNNPNNTEANVEFLNKYFRNEAAKAPKNGEREVYANFKTIYEYYYNAGKKIIEHTKYVKIKTEVINLTEGTPLKFDETGAVTSRAEDGLNNLEYKFNQLKSCFISNTDIKTVNEQITNLAKYEAGGITSSDNLTIPGRGDCVALVELNETLYRNTTNTKPEILIVDAIRKNCSNIGSQYCAMTVPSVVYKMSPEIAYDGNRKFPGAFHYLACFAQSLNLGFAEWYAAAGYTRGVSNYVVDYTTVKLGEIAINNLEPRYKDDIPNADSRYPLFACNVIANFRGSYYLWGNRTCYPIGKKGNPKNGDLTASSFLNIRQLCSTIKKQLYVSCRQFTFDPNSDTLWFNFVNAIKPTLDLMRADQGIKDYKIVKEFTDKKATLKARIRIIPIEAVEDFDLEVSLEDSFGSEVAVSIAG